MLPEKVGRYPVVGELGRGGFATVFLAEDRNLDDRVAIKLLSEHYSADPGLVTRFIAEARVMRDLAAPGLVTVYDSGEHEGRPFFVMEYCERGTLGDRLDLLNRRLSIEEGLGLGVALGRAMAGVHRASPPVVHRDLKPGNLLIRHTPRQTQQPVGGVLGTDEELIVGDFGLAKIVNMAATQLSIIAFTQGFAAPEQARGDPTIDPSADVYSASAIVTAAITGVAPTQVLAPDQKVFEPQVLHATGQLRPALEQGLAFDRRHRPATMNDWVAALTSVIQPAPPFPPPPPQQRPTQHEQQPIDPLAEIDLGIEDLDQFKEVGSGGFATVYAAWDGGFRRWVAVKVLHSLDDDGRRRFDRERGLMGQFDDHINIVTPYRFGYTQTGSPYLVMEYLRGGSLDDLLVNDGPVPVEKAIGYVVPVARALGRAHSDGVLHRDVKPANILLTSDGVPKLTDFGIATIREGTSTQLGFTLAHTPPETFATGRDERDERSDLYSLASTLYTLVAGRPPFQVGGADSQPAYMRRLETLPVPPTGTGWQPLDAFLVQALAKNPAHRPQNAAQFINRLDQVLTQPETSQNQPSEETSTQTKPPITPPPNRNSEVEREDKQREAVPDAPPTSEPTPRPQEPSESEPVNIDPAASTVHAHDNKERTRDRPQPVSDTTGEAARLRLTSEKSPSLKRREGALVITAILTAILVVASLIYDNAADRSTYTGHTSAVWALVELSDGRIASASTDDTVQIWDPDDLDTTIATYTGHTSAVWALVELSDGRIASASTDDTVQIWDPDDPDTTIAIYVAHDDTVEVVVELSDGRIASASTDMVHIWDPVGLDPTIATYPGHNDTVEAVVELSDGRIASASADDTVQIWDPDDPDTTIATYTGHNSNVRAVVELSDGRIASASWDDTVQIWDPADPDTTIATYAGHNNDMWALVELSDGRVASASADNTVQIWDPDDPDTTIATYTGHNNDVRALVELSDGRIASASTDRVRIWDPAALN